MIRLFPYYGSKHRIARRYPAPVYGTIVEPFAGAAGYSCHWHTRNVILYEKDPVVFGTLHYLIHASPAEIRALPLLEPGQSIDDLSVCQEAKWLMGWWVNVGSAAPCKSLSKWARLAVQKGRHCERNVWGPTCRERLSYGCSRIKHWKVYQGTYQDIKLRRACTWFVDPPYQKAGGRYTCSSDGIDFDALGQWCRKLSGQAIVCENDGATWLPFEPFCLMTGAAKVGSGRKITKEVVWYNAKPVGLLY